MANGISNDMEKTYNKLLKQYGQSIENNINTLANSKEYMGDARAISAIKKAKSGGFEDAFDAENQSKAIVFSTLRSAAELISKYKVAKEYVDPEYRSMYDEKIAGIRESLNNLASPVDLNTRSTIQQFKSTINNVHSVDESGNYLSFGSSTSLDAGGKVEDSSLSRIMGSMANSSVIANVAMNMMGTINPELGADMQEQNEMVAKGVFKQSPWEKGAEIVGTIATMALEQRALRGVAKAKVLRSTKAVGLSNAKTFADQVNSTAKKMSYGVQGFYLPVGQAINDDIGITQKYSDLLNADDASKYTRLLGDGVQNTASMLASDFVVAPALDIMGKRWSSKMFQKNYKEYMKINNKDMLNPVVSEVTKKTVNESDAVKYAIGRVLFSQQGLLPATKFAMDTGLDVAMDILAVSGMDLAFGGELNTQQTRMMYSGVAEGSDWGEVIKNSLAQRFMLKAGARFGNAIMESALQGHTKSDKSVGSTKWITDEFGYRPSKATSLFSSISGSLFGDGLRDYVTFQKQLRPDSNLGDMLLREKDGNIDASSTRDQLELFMASAYINRYSGNWTANLMSGALLTGSTKGKELEAIFSRLYKAEDVVNIGAEAENLGKFRETLLALRKEGISTTNIAHDEQGINGNTFNNIVRQYITDEYMKPGDISVNEKGDVLFNNKDKIASAFKALLTDYKAYGDTSRHTVELMKTFEYAIRSSMQAKLNETDSNGAYRISQDIRNKADISKADIFKSIKDIANPNIRSSIDSTELNEIGKFTRVFNDVLMSNDTMKNNMSLGLNGDDLTNFSREIHSLVSEKGLIGKIKDSAKTFDRLLNTGVEMDYRIIGDLIDGVESSIGKGQSVEDIKAKFSSGNVLKDVMKLFDDGISRLAAKYESNISRIVNSKNAGNAASQRDIAINTFKLLTLAQNTASDSAFNTMRKLSTNLKAVDEINKVLAGNANTYLKQLLSNETHFEKLKSKPDQIYQQLASGLIEYGSRTKISKQRLNRLMTLDRIEINKMNAVFGGDGAKRYNAVWEDFVSHQDWNISSNIDGYKSGKENAFTLVLGKYVSGNMDDIKKLTDEDVDGAYVAALIKAQLRDMYDNGTRVSSHGATVGVNGNNFDVREKPGITKSEKLVFIRDSLSTKISRQIQRDVSGLYEDMADVNTTSFSIRGQEYTVDRLDKLLIDSSIYGPSILSAIRTMVRSNGDKNSAVRGIVNLVQEKLNSTDADIVNYAKVLYDRYIMQDYHEIVLDIIGDKVVKENIGFVPTDKPTYLHKLGFDVVNMSMPDDMKNAFFLDETKFKNFKSEMNKRGLYTIGVTGNATEPFWVKVPMVMDFDNNKLIPDISAIKNAVSDSMEATYKSLGMAVVDTDIQAIKDKNDINDVLKAYIDLQVKLAKDSNSTENVSALRNIRREVDMSVEAITQQEAYLREYEEWANKNTNVDQNAIDAKEAELLAKYPLFTRNAIEAYKTPLSEYKFNKSIQNDMRELVNTLQDKYESMADTIEQSSKEVIVLSEKSSMEDISKAFNIFSSRLTEDGKRSILNLYNKVRNDILKSFISKENIKREADRYDSVFKEIVDSVSKTQDAIKKFEQDKLKTFRDGDTTVLLENLFLPILTYGHTFIGESDFTKRASSYAMSSPFFNTKGDYIDSKVKDMFEEWMQDGSKIWFTAYEAGNDGLSYAPSRYLQIMSGMYGLNNLGKNSFNTVYGGMKLNMLPTTSLDSGKATNLRGLDGFDANKDFVFDMSSFKTVMATFGNLIDADVLSRMGTNGAFYIDVNTLGLKIDSADVDNGKELAKERLARFVASIAKHSEVQTKAKKNGNVSSNIGQLHSQMDRVIVNAAYLDINDDEYKDIKEGETVAQAIGSMKLAAKRLETKSGSLMAVANTWNKKRRQSDSYSTILRDSQEVALKRLISGGEDLHIPRGSLSGSAIYQAILTMKTADGKYVYNDKLKQALKIITNVRDEDFGTRAIIDRALNDTGYSSRSEFELDILDALEKIGMVQKWETDEFKQQMNSTKVRIKELENTISSMENSNEAKLIQAMREENDKWKGRYKSLYNDYAGKEESDLTVTDTTVGLTDPDDIANAQSFDASRLNTKKATLKKFKEYERNQAVIDRFNGILDRLKNEKTKLTKDREYKAIYTFNAKREPKQHSGQDGFAIFDGIDFGSDATSIETTWIMTIGKADFDGDSVQSRAIHKNILKKSINTVFGMGDIKNDTSEEKVQDIEYLRRLNDMTAQAYEMYYKNNIHVIKDKALIDTPHWSYASPGVMVSSLSYAEYSRWVLKSASDGINSLVSDYVKKEFNNDNSTSQFSSTIDAIVRSVEAEGVESNALIFFDNLHGSNKKFKYHTADIDHAHASIGKIGDKDYKVMITSVNGSIARALLVDDSPSPELSGKIISESFIDLSKISGIAGIVPKLSGNKWAVLHTVADMFKGVIESSTPKTEKDIISILSNTAGKYEGNTSQESYISKYSTVIGKSFTNIHMLNSIANGVGPDHMKNHTLKVLASYNPSALKDLVIASTVIPRMEHAKLKISTIDYSANGYTEKDIMNVLTNKGIYNGITDKIIEYIKSGGNTNVSTDDYAAVLKVTGNSVATNDEFITALKVIQKAGGKMAGDDEVLRGNKNAGIEMSNLPIPMFQLTNSLRRSNKALQDTLSNRMKDIKDMMNEELVDSLGPFLGSTKIMMGDTELIVENTTGVLDDLLATRQMIDEELGDVPFMNRNDKVNVFAIKERTPFTFSTVLESKDATLIEKIASISGVETSDVTKYLANKGLRIEASDIKGTVDVIRRGVIENGIELSSTLINKLTENAKTNNMTYALYDNSDRMLSVKDVFNKLLESTIDIKDTTMSTPEYRILRTMIYLADNSQMSTFKYLSEGLSTETIRDLTDGKIDIAKFERLYKSKNKTKTLNKLGFLDDELMSSSDLRDIIVKENGGCR